MEQSKKIQYLWEGGEVWDADEGFLYINTKYDIYVPEWKNGRRTGRANLVTCYRYKDKEGHVIYVDIDNDHYYYRTHGGPYNDDTEKEDGEVEIPENDTKFAKYLVPIVNEDGSLFTTTGAIKDWKVKQAYETYKAQDEKQKTEQAITAAREKANEQANTPSTNTNPNQTPGGYTINAPNSPGAAGTSTQEAAEAEYQKRKNEANAQLMTLLNRSVEPITPAAKEDQTVYYQYGQNQIDLNYYLHNIGTNLQNYLDSKGWSSAQKDAFMRSYNQYKQALTDQLNSGSNRFKTDDSGRFVDMDGILSGDNGRIFIDANGDTYDYLEEIDSKRMRRSAIEFSPNDEVANYFSIIGKAIVDSGKVKNDNANKPGKFDLSNDGFQTYWLKKVNPAGGTFDLDPYIKLDPVGLDGKRSRENRVLYLIHELQNYATKIRTGNYDFEGTGFTNKTDYLNKIQQAINNLSNGWDDTDPATLQAVGIPSSFYNDFFTDQADPHITPEQQAAQQEEEATKKKETAASDYISQLVKRYDDWKNTPWNQNSSGYVFSKEHPVTWAYMRMYNPHKDYGGETAQNTILQTLRKWGVEGFDTSNLETLKQNYSTGMTDATTRILKALNSNKDKVTFKNEEVDLSTALTYLLPSMLQTSSFTADDNGIMTYVGDIDNILETGRVLCVDVPNQKVYFDSLNNHRKNPAWQRFQTNFEQGYASLSEPQTDKPTYSFGEGGILKMEGGGETPSEGSNLSEENAALLAEAQAQVEESGAETSSSNDFLDILGTSGSGLSMGDEMAALFTEDAVSKRIAKAKERHMDVAQYSAKQRELFGAPTDLDKNNGVLKTEDYFRIGACIADITSLVLDPVSGAAANVGSTVSNFIADLNDESVTTGESFKNLFSNLGMDALSVIPVFGDAAGTGVKLLKNVKKIVPVVIKVMTAYGIIATLKNSGNILESFKKVLSDENLTVGDWQNIAQGLSACAGLNGAVRHGYAKKTATNRARKPDAIGLRVAKKKDNGTLDNSSAKDIILEGEHARKIREAVEEGDVAKVNKELQEIEQFKDYEVKTNYATHILEGHMPFGRTKNDDGSKSWGFKAPITTRKVIDSFDIYDKSALREGYWTRTQLNTNRQDAAQRNGQHYTAEDLLSTAQRDAIRTKPFEGPEVEAAQQASARVEAEIARKKGEIEGYTDEQGQHVKGVREELAEAATNEKTALNAQNVAAKKAQAQSRNAHMRSQDVTVNGKTENIDISTDKGKARAKEVEAELIKKKETSQKAITAARKKIEARDELKRKHDLLSELEVYKKQNGLDLNDAEKKQAEKLIDQLDKAESAAKDAEANLSFYEQKLKGIDAEYEKVHNWEENVNESTKIRDELTASTKAFIDAENTRKAVETKLNDLEQKLNDYIQEKQTEHTPEYNALLKKYNLWDENYPWDYSALDVAGWQHPNHYSVTIDNLKDVLNNLGIKYRTGGRMIPKAQNGGSSGVGLQGNQDTWFKALFKPYLRTLLLTKISNDSNYWQVINKYQKAHHDIYEAAGGESGSWATTAYQGQDNSVQSYQDWYNGEGFNNEVIGKVYNTRYKLRSSNPTSGDSPNQDSEGKTWRSDNLFSTITDERRILGRKSDWKDQAEIDSFNKDLAQYKLKMVADPDGYMYLKQLNDDGTIKDENADLEMLPEYTGPQRSQAEIEQERRKKEQEQKLAATINRIGHLTPDPIDLLAYRSNSADNARRFKNHLANIFPLYQNPQRDYRLVHSGLNYENQGEKMAGSYWHLGQKAISSDSDKTMAYQMELNEKAQQARLAGFTKSDQIYRTTQEADAAQRIKNHENEHKVAEENIKSAHKTNQEKTTIRSTYDAYQQQNKDNLLKAWAQKVKTFNATREKAALTDYSRNLTTAIRANPIIYGVDLNASDQELWNTFINGGSYSKLSDPEKVRINRIETAITNRVNDYMSAYMGLDSTSFSTATATTLPSFTTILSDNTSGSSSVSSTTLDTPAGTQVSSTGAVKQSKDGSKLEIAKLKARIKDAERFQRSIEKSLELLDKQVARAAKTMSKN